LSHIFVPWGCREEGRLDYLMVSKGGGWVT
jgi:hypothetical protein